MPRPAYERIEADLRRRIKAGEWKPGQRLPTESQLTEEYGASLQPVRTALMRLEIAGLVVRRQGGATIVALPATVEPRTSYSPGHGGWRPFVIDVEMDLPAGAVARRRRFRRPDSRGRRAGQRASFGAGGIGGRWAIHRATDDHRRRRCPEGIGQIHQSTV